MFIYCHVTTFDQSECLKVQRYFGLGIFELKSSDAALDQNLELRHLNKIIRESLTINSRFKRTTSPFGVDKTSHDKDAD